MEILESIGFTHFWGLSPALNVIDKEYEKDTLNVLLSGTSDLRHILKTLADNLEDPKNIKNINFYFHEKQKEPFARALLLLEVLHLSNLNYRERIDLFCDIFGNNLVRQKTQRFIDQFIPQLEKFLTGDDKALTVLKKLVSLKTIKYKEKDQLVDIVRSWNGKIPYEMEKHRDQRLRYILKTRYDYKKNMIDWDYNMGILNVCPILHYIHYKEWRLTGVAFESRFSSYIVPNRTMSSYIPGKNKKEYTSCMVRGYWGDIIISPYIAFGVESEYEPLLFKVANKQQCGNTVEVTEFNLEYFLQMIDTQTEYIKEFTDMYRQKESRKQNGVIVDPKDIQRQERERLQKEQEEEEKKKKKEEDYREEEVEMIPEEENEDDQDEETKQEEEVKEEEEKQEEEKQQEVKQQDQQEEVKLDKEKEEQKTNALDEPIQDSQDERDRNELSRRAQQKEQQLQDQDQEDTQSEHSLASTQPEEPRQNQENQNSDQQEGDLYVEKEHEVLSGFEKIKINIMPVFEDLNTLLTRKKWHNFFDIGVVGFTMNGQFGNKDFKQLFHDQSVIFGERNQFLVPMKKEDKQKYEEQLLELAKEGGLKKTDFDKTHHYRFELAKQKK